MKNVGNYFKLLFIVKCNMVHLFNVFNDILIHSIVFFKPQCHRYWPENGSEIFHIYEVRIFHSCSIPIELFSTF